MRPLVLLRCVARAALKAAGNAVGLGAVADLADDVWREWSKDATDAARRAELEEVVRMAAGEFRRQVEVVVREIASDQPPEVRDRVSAYLEQIPDLARRQFRRPDDQKGAGVPPGLRLDSAALASILPVSVPAPGPAPAVTLRYTAGPFAGREVTYTRPAVLLFGKVKGCDPKLPDADCRRVSRRHCFVEVNPPDVRVRDLGSMHGTYVNGHLIGKRPKGADPAPGYDSPDHPLADGDEVRLSDRGQVAFAVRITAPSAPAARACAWCQRAVAEPGANRPGLFVCAACRADMQRMVREAAGGSAEGPAAVRAVKDYELLEELGHGGMGAVYLARHRKTGAAAAVKLMLPKVAADDRAVELFQREVRNTMALSHRNVVRCLNHGYAKGAFFLVLEYCDGGTAAGLAAARGGTLPVDEAMEITLQALDGLAYAHAAEVPLARRPDGTYGPGRGLVHRDVKPANLFLSGWGSGRVVKVGDFGLAKGFDEAGLSGGTRTGEVAGTWEFMCRSQVVGYKDAGPEVDVWAAAASLYNLLTGHLPRDFPDGKDPWMVVLEDDPVPVLTRSPSVPRRLAELVDHALREEPEMPFRTAAEFRRELEAVA